jgi:hypothetical protein
MCDEEIPVLKPGLELVPAGQQQPVPDAAGRQLYDATRASVVQIVTNRGRGTGFITDNEGGIMTDFHVIDGAQEIFVVGQDGKRYKAGIDRIDDTGDLATLKLLAGKSPGPAVTFGSSTNLKPDQALWGVSHPKDYRTPFLSPGYFRFRTTPLNIHALRAPNPIEMMAAETATWTPREQKDFVDFMTRPSVQASMHQDHGSSGGPIFNANREVVGITQLSVDQNMAYLGTSERAQSLLTGDRKFTVGHGLRSAEWTRGYKGLWHNQAATAGLLTATAGGIGYLGYRGAARFPKVAGVALAFHGASNLFDNIPNYYAFIDSRDSWKYGLESGGNLLETIGGIAMLFPRARTVGAIVAAIGLGTSIASDFVPNRYVVTDISRTDGTAHPPFSMLRRRHNNINLLQPKDEKGKPR